MSKQISQKTLHYLEEFNQMGFIKVDAYNDCNRYAIDILRLEPYTRLFKGATARRSKGSIKYSGFDFFGETRLTFLYNINETDKFLEHLYSFFYIKNPEPTKSLYKAFSRLLSSNYLISKDYNWKLNRNGDLLSRATVPNQEQTIKIKE